MRCAECGQELADLPGHTPCPECGVVTPEAARLPLPRVNKLWWAWLYAWPFLLALLAGAVAGRFASGSDETVMWVLFIAALAIGILGAAINSAVRTVQLMRRIPKRARHAPLLFLIPRTVAIAGLAALASAAIGGVLAVGSCFTVGISGYRG